VVRTGIELTVLLAGIALGGSIGIGTLAYALAIGPLLHLLLPVLTVPASRAGATGGTTSPASTPSEASHEHDPVRS
jgi:hypothetical protein